MADSPQDSEVTPPNLSSHEEETLSTNTPSFQLVFGMDDESSEASLTSPSPLQSYLPPTGSEDFVTESGSSDVLPESECSDVVPQTGSGDSVSESVDLVLKSESTDVVPESGSGDLVPESGSVNLTPKLKSNVNSDGVPEPESNDSVPEPESSDRVPEPESSDRVPEPESSDRVPEPESSDGVLVPESSDKVPEPESSDKVPEPESSYGVPEPESKSLLPDISTKSDIKSVDKSPSDDTPSPTDSVSSSSLTTPLSSIHTSSGGVLFDGIHYLGSSTVDAPVSENEANRKMSVLKNQAAQSIPVTLSIPENNAGSIVLKDPSSDQVLVAFFIRYVLFCARGQQETDLHDCIAINVLHKRSGVYHCHVFRCDISDACQRVFEAIGKAFKSKPASKEDTDNQLTYELDVTIDIQEEDLKGNYSSVSMDKDCFKLRSSSRKRLLFNITQTTSNSPLKFEKCFGLLMAIGQDVPRNKLQLLETAQISISTLSESSVFTVSSFWDTSLPYLSPLNEESSKSKYHILTVATDLVATSVNEPIRLSREIKVRVSKGETFGSLLSTLTRRKLPMETFTLNLEKLQTNESSGQYKVKSLKSTKDNIPLATASPSPSLSKDHKVEIGRAAVEDSPSMRKISKQKLKDNTEHEESDAEPEDDILVSGWGEEGTDLRDDLLKLWHDMLEKWDGRDKWEPKGEKTRSRQLVKLVRKGIPGPLRCQIWQMLSGADNDPQLIEAYRILFTKDSPTESVIKWDIKRTYVGHEFFQEASGKDSLYKISKAYSVYDSEVGYCQGFSFMAAVLLLQKIPEEQAFAIMVKIMFNYGHRDMFKANFKELHLMFYQLERLLEEYHHELYCHFIHNSVETHMYASQWFLTIFTAKFPLHVIYHIIDIYLCEGVVIVFQIALSLLKLAQKELLALDFEGILSYFRAELPKKFGTEEDAKLLFATADNYNKITHRKLKKLEKEYQAYLEQQALLEDPVIRMERENKQLRENVLRLQRENDDLAEELVASKVALRGDMDKLEERIDELSKECRAQKSSLDASNLLTSELREELQQAKETYQKAMMQLMEERQQHEVAIAEYKQVFQQLDEGHQKQKEELNQELLEVKARLGNTGGAELSEEDHLSSLSSEQRLRQVELELAQTKLALVEAECKNQELEHKVIELNNELSSSKGKPSWRSRFT